MRITVEIDLFSGRPNPKWMLEGDEALPISKLLINLLPFKAPVPDPGLGYKGFVLTVEAGGRQQTAHVYAGTIWFNDDSQTVWKDAAGLEGLLLQEAKKRGYKETLQSFGL